MPILLALLLLAFAPVCEATDGETVIRDLGKTRIIPSNEAPHNILSDACLACHPKEKFEFWLLIYKGKPPTVSVDRLRKPEAADAPGTPSGKPAQANRYNSHDGLACNLCHFDNPTGTTPKFIVDVADLCRLCHPAVEPHRLPEGEGLDVVRKAIRERKLPGRDGNLLCTTCHKTHDATFSMRDAYAQVLWEGKVPNPHGSRQFCFACHPGKIREGEEIRFAAGRDNNRLCNECHLRPGVRKAPHVIDLTSSEGTWRMDYLGYPLNQGKLTCSTCHDEVSHGKPDSANPKFLRGGPYADPDRFCYRCHSEEKEVYDNPHRQVDAFGRVRGESCRFCHKGIPDPDRRKPEDLELVGEDASVCSNCHQIRPHPGAEHGVLLKGEKLARKEEYEKRHQVRLPLAADGKIKCSTCHNPHAKGVLKGEAGVGAGSRWRVPDFREMCAPCHGRY
ncbi:MAG: hypothetical protein HZB86_03440 [Deltaproteobacteria bacterium]|nr:hypothetical protein [Deltaproteobacteria bacterium]